MAAPVRRMTAFRFGDYRIDAATRELTDAGGTVPLPPRVFDCLKFLIERRDRAVGRDELIDAMWGARGATDVQLAQLVLQCRRAVGDDGQAQRAIRTVAGFGYRWVAPVDAPAVDAATNADSTSQEPVVDSTSPRSRARIGWTIMTAAILVAAIALVLRRAPPARPGAEAARVLVAPIRVEDADARWLRLGGMDVVVNRLRANRVPVLPSDATVAMLRGDANDTQDAIAAHARDAGARTTVTLSAARADALWRITATIRDAGASERTERVEGADPLVALRQIADRISGALGYAAAEPMPSGGNPAVALTLQQARAALLANDIDGARTLLASNAALVADEPLLQEQLAEVDIRAGRYAQAAKAIEALLARGDNPPAFRATLLNARGLVDVRTGRFARAGDDFSQALALLGAGADPIVLGRAHLGKGISLTSLQDYAGAQGEYARAREAFERAGDPGSVARVDSDLGALENLRGHPSQAAIYLDRARERFASLGMIQEEINALQLLFVARRAELADADAADAIDRAWAQRDRIVSPSSILSTGLYRVESLLRLGRLSEADALIASLGESGRPAASAEGERYALMRASLLAAHARYDQALAVLEGISEAPHASADDDTVRAGVGVLRARLQRQLGRPGDAPSGNAGDDVAPPTPRTPLRHLADANRAWARGDAPAADRAFGEALALADSQGIPETIAEVASDDVAYLAASGRAAEAGVVAARVALWADADFGCALTVLRAAEARHDRAAVDEALSRVRRLAGERGIPPALAANAD
jgi:DNA-binding winged helix-turn-helix (wHTH) protein/tetratricopeptide (TPR) repeat protein